MPHTQYSKKCELCGYIIPDTDDDELAVQHQMHSTGTVPTCELIAMEPAYMDIYDYETLERKGLL